jgi:hypothetical protein
MKAMRVMSFSESQQKAPNRDSAQALIRRSPYGFSLPLAALADAISESVSCDSKGLRRHSGSSPAADRRAGSRDVGRASPEGAVDFAVLAFWAFDEPKNQRKQ